MAQFVGDQDGVLDPDERYDGPGRSGDALVVTVNAQTGTVTVSPVDPTDANGDGLGDDPFYFAETGVEDVQ